MEIEKLFVSLALDAAKYSKGLKDSQKEGATWAQRMKTSIGGGLKAAAKLGAGALLGVGAVIAGVAREATQEFKEFERGMREVFTLMPNITADAMKKMESEVLQFSAAVGRQTDETIPALYQAISAGVPQENVFEFLEVASNAALGGVTDLETAVDGITSVTNAYGTEVLGAAEASDIMFTAVKLGKTDFNQLSASLFNVIPTAASLGVSFGDVAAQLAVLTSQGTPTSVATTQIRSALVEASKGGTKLSDAIKDLTGKSFTDLIAQGHSSAEIFQLLRTSMPEQEFKDLFGSVESLNAVLGITGPNAGKTAAAMLEMENASGATAAAADTMSQSYEHLQNETVAAKEQLLIMVGEGLVPGQRAMEEFKRDTLLLAGALIQLNHSADTASEGVADLVESGEDADINARKMLDTWNSLDDFWGRSVFGRGKIRDDMQRVVASSVDLSGSNEDVRRSLQDLDPAFRMTNDGMILLDDTVVGHIGALQDLQSEQRAVATAAAAASSDAVFFAQAMARTTQQTELTTDATDELTRSYEQGTDAADMYAEATQLTAIQSGRTADQFVHKRDKAIKLAEAQIELAEAERVAAQAAAEHAAQLGGYFDAALTATDQTVSMERQLYDAAVASGAGAVELSILAAATGDFSDAEIEAAFQAALMRENIEQLATAVANGSLTADEAVNALNRLKDSEVTTAAEAINLAGAASQAQGDLDGISGAAYDARDALSSIPTNIQIDITTNYATTGNPNAGTEDYNPYDTSGQYQMGGWTGYGGLNEFAGIVHRGELVVPSRVLRDGMAGIMNFAAQNVPSGAGGNGFNVANYQPKVSMSGAAQDAGGYQDNRQSSTTVQLAPGQDPLRALRAARHLDKLGRGAG